MNVSVQSFKDGSALASSISIPDHIMSAEFNETLVHQAMVSYQAAARAGTKAQKSRSEVSGGGKKPWRQKGTGRARAGTTRGPLWRKGGVTFAAKPRDYSKKMNTKMYRCALRSVVAELSRSKRLVVVDNFEIDNVKTSEAKKILDRFEGRTKYLLDVSAMPKNCDLSVRNLPHVVAGDIKHLHFVALLHYDCVIISQQALQKLGEVL